MPPARLFPAFYCNELLMKLLARGDPHAALFDAYADALQALAVAADETPLRAFELQLLRETGVLPELVRVTTTQAPVRAAGSYQLGGDAGLAEAASDDPTALPGHVCQALQAALDRGDGAALRRACQGALPVLRTQLRALLHYHLGTPALRTRALMLDVRRLLDAAPAAAPTS
jgi:DNA repair protein RecO (recombination protein O)